MVQQVELEQNVAAIHMYLKFKKAVIIKLKIIAQKTQLYYIYHNSIFFIGLTGSVVLLVVSPKDISDVLG